MFIKYITIWINIKLKADRIFCITDSFLIKCILMMEVLCGVKIRRIYSLINPLNLYFKLIFKKRGIDTYTCNGEC